MIEGRPRESLVQYENPIEVIKHFLIFTMKLDFSWTRYERSIQKDIWL